MQPDNEDEAWRSIIENYGDRAQLDDPPPAPPAPPASAAPPVPFGGRFGDARDLGGANAEPDDGSDPFDTEDGFEPPAPPPLPRASPDRLAAWFGVFGSPTLLLAALIFSVPLPAVVGYLMIAAFVGGFVYLVVKMPRGPRDPWDDGAQV